MRLSRPKTKNDVQTNPAFYVADEIQKFLEEQNWSEQLMFDEQSNPNFGTWLACCCFCLPCCVALVIKNSCYPLKSDNEADALFKLITALDIIGKTPNPASTSGMFAQGTDPKALRTIDAINNALSNGNIVTYKPKLENLQALIASINGALLRPNQSEQKKKNPTVRSSLSRSV